MPSPLSRPVRQHCFCCRWISVDAIDGLSAEAGGLCDLPDALTVHVAHDGELAVGEARLASPVLDIAFLGPRKGYAAPLGFLDRLGVGRCRQEVKSARPVLPDAREP